MQLHLPDPLPLLRIGHLEQNVGANAPLERGVHVRGQIGREDDDTREGLELVEEHVDDRVGFALHRCLHGREPPAGDRVGLVEEEHRVLPLGRPEHRRHVLGGLAHPARLELGIAHHQQPPIEGVRQRLGADGLPRSRRAGEVERQAQAGVVPLGETPLTENEIVLSHQGEGVVQRAKRPLGEDHVVEGPAGLDSLDQVPGRGPEEQIANGIGHSGNMHPSERAVRRHAAGRPD